MKQCDTKQPIYGRVNRTKTSHGKMTSMKIFVFLEVTIISVIFQIFHIISMWDTVNGTSQICIKPFVLSDSAKQSTLSPEFMNLLNHAESQNQLNLSQSMNPLSETTMSSVPPQQSFASNLLSNSSQFLNSSKSSSTITPDQIEPNNNLLGTSTPSCGSSSLPSPDTNALQSQFSNPSISPSPNTPDQIEQNNSLLGTSTPSCGSNPLPSPVLTPSCSSSSLPSPVLNQPSNLDRMLDSNLNRESPDSSQDNFQQSFQDISQLLSSLKHSSIPETSSLVTTPPAPPYTPPTGSPTSPYTPSNEYHSTPHNRHTVGPQHLNYISIKPVTLPPKFHQELDKLLSKLPSTSPQVIHQNSYRNLNSNPPPAVSSDLYSCQSNSEPVTFPYTNTVTPQSQPGADPTAVSSLLNQLLNSPAAVNQLKSILSNSDPQSDSPPIDNNICSREAPFDKPSLNSDFIKYLSTLPRFSQSAQ